MWNFSVWIGSKGRLSNFFCKLGILFWGLHLKTSWLGNVVLYCRIFVRNLIPVAFVKAIFWLNYIPDQIFHQTTSVGSEIFMNVKINDISNRATTDSLTKINSWRTAGRSLLTKFFAARKFLDYTVVWRWASRLGINYCVQLADSIQHWHWSEILADWNIPTVYSVWSCSDVD